MGVLFGCWQDNVLGLEYVDYDVGRSVSLLTYLAKAYILEYATYIIMMNMLEYITYVVRVQSPFNINH